MITITSPTTFTIIITIIIITSGVLEHKGRTSLNYTIVKLLILTTNIRTTKIKSSC